jgi:hypothetical protein
MPLKGGADLIEGIGHSRWLQIGGISVELVQFAITRPSLQLQEHPAATCFDGHNIITTVETRYISLNICLHGASHHTI